jgi:ADP-ribose pyrophosphatase YjhB (NUDIX family)
MPHIHEQIDFTVEVFIVYKHTVLLRKHDKLGIWLSVGGHIELDEDPNQAAIREVKEEVDLDIELDNSLQIYHPENPNYKQSLSSRNSQVDTQGFMLEDRELIPPYFINRHTITETHEHVTFVYFAKTNSPEIVQPENEKSEELKWFTKEELETSTDIKENIKFYALKSLEKLSASS